MRQVFVYGASGHAKVVIDILYQGKKYDIIGLIDDNKELKDSMISEYKILGGEEALIELKNEGIYMGIAAIGNNNLRDSVYKKIKDMGFDIITAVHPSAILGSRVKIGEGTVVMPNVVINVDSVIGNNCIVNTSASIDHECTIGQSAHISPGVRLAGGVKIGDLTHIGIGSVVIQGITIGSNTVVGAGSVVTKDIADNCVAVGIPARVIKVNGKPVQQNS